MASIQFHETIHGLHTGRGRGTRTTSLEAKLLQHMMDMREEVIYDIFYIFINTMTSLTVASAWKPLQHKEWAPRSTRLIQR